MNIKTKITALLLGATLAVSCTKAPDTDQQGSSELDWSRTSAITLDRVAMAPSAKTADPLMKVGQTFRLYAIDPKTKNIIATRTYSIATTDGIPVIDATQNPIINLPFGVVDVFLVGPVKATLYGMEYKIADSTKVNPMRGVDLISSKTKVIIKAKETPITPTPLQHRMVKLELAVSMEKDGEPNPADLSSYKNARMWGQKHLVSVDNVAVAGTWAFDEGGGSVSGTIIDTCRYTYTEHNTGEQNLKLTDPGIVGTDSDTTGTAYSAYDYVFPTAATQPKLNIMFGYTFRTVPTDVDGNPLVPADVENQEMWGKTATKLNWAAGTYVKLHTKLTPSINMTVHTQILPWDDGGSTPIEPSVNNDLIFWYSGEDAPEMIDGKMCWRDRSGNGNHAVINGSMTYDEVNKCYISTDGAFFGVPSLGAVPEYTLEFEAQCKAVAKGAAADFDGYHGILLNLPYNTGLVWYNSISNDWGQHTAYGYGDNDKYIYEQLSSYAFCRNQTTAAIVINGVEKKVEAKAGPWLDFNNNRLWVTDAGYVDKTYKLYGAKMYKKYMNNTTGRNTLAANHAAKLSRLGVTAPLSGTTFDYVKDGLILDLRGETAPSGTDPNRVWTDLSGRGNSPKLEGTVVYNQDATTGLHFYEGTSTTAKFRFQKSLGTYKELTIEVVYVLTAATVDKPLIQFLGSNSRRTSIYLGWPGDGHIFEGPCSPPWQAKVRIPAANLKYGSLSGVFQMSCCRRGDKLYSSQNGYLYSDFVANVSSNEVNALANGLIHTDYQRIYAVRIYDRALSDFERQHNYLVDKAKYNLLP